MAAEHPKKAVTTGTRRGKPLATAGPAPKPYKSLKGIFKGQLKITDADIRAVRKAMWDPKRLKEKFDL
jgi:hypothetical protein